MLLKDVVGYTLFSVLYVPKRYICNLKSVYNESVV